MEKTKNRDFKDFNIEIVDTGLNTQIAKRIFLIKEKVHGHFLTVV